MYRPRQRAPRRRLPPAPPRSGLPSGCVRWRRASDRSSSTISTVGRQPWPGACETRGSRPGDAPAATSQLGVVDPLGAREPRDSSSPGARRVPRSITTASGPGGEQGDRHDARASVAIRAGRGSGAPMRIAARQVARSMCEPGLPSARMVTVACALYCSAGGRTLPERRQRHVTTRYHVSTDRLQRHGRRPMAVTVDDRHRPRIREQHIAGVGQRDAECRRSRRCCSIQGARLSGANARAMPGHGDDGDQCRTRLDRIPLRSETDISRSNDSAEMLARL